MNAAELFIDNVDVTYPNGFTAVKGAQLHLQAGEIVALLGDSGSGKSTLLRAIAGLEKVTAGNILIGTESGIKNISQIPVHKRNIGLVFQDGQLFPHRNVARNIGYGLEMQKMPKRKISARVTELLDLVSLAGYEKRPINTLSGGQAQRVALARALAPQPNILLLDEPLSALDRNLRQSLAVQLREIIKKTGITAIFVTHDYEEAQLLADRVVTIKDGTI
ncbi:MAG: ABC transporter [Actinomycetales bacterium]|nr:MAG: ABC transporter [Actinomycetales bacterium]